MIRFGTYLLKNGFGVYHFRMAVPADLRPILGKRELKKSLGTSDLICARKRAYAYAIEAHFLLKEAREKMSKTKPPFFRSSSFELDRFVSRADGSVEIAGLKTDPSSPQDIADLNSFLGKLQDFLKSENQSITPSPAPSQPSQPPQTAQMLLDELFESYKHEKKQSGEWRSAKTERDHDATFGAILRILGNIAISTIDRQLAAHLKTVLYKLPSNVTKKPAYRNLSIQQVLALNPTDTLSHHAVKKYLDRLSSVFTFAVANGIADENPFQHVKPKQNRVKGSQLRSAYSQLELQILFSTGIYTTLSYKKPHHYWLPLLGLFTGARLSELCQLKLDDIYYKDDILIIDINEESEDKSVKTEAGIRRVPVHSTLLNLNFEHYIHSLKQAKSTLLFPEITPYQDARYNSIDWGNYISKWFSGHLKKIGIKHSKLTFHSFRHTLATALKNALVPRELAATLAGHVVSDLTYGHYGKDYDIEVLKDAIEKANFSAALGSVLPYK